MTSETERASLLRKDQLERSLFEEKKLIDEGILKEDNPLDTTESFRVLCEACRRGDLKVCQEKISEGVNINAKDRFDYTPLILASLCGNYETVQLLLESGALCERDTFQGERCLYNALNDRIRNLLLSYDYSKSTDPLQPLAAHLTSLLSRDQPQTADIQVTGYEETFNLHKFVLAGRSPYFQKKLAVNPETTLWKMPLNLPPQSFAIVLKHIYLGELPRDLGGGPGTGFTDSEVLAGVDRIVKQLEIPTNLSKMILDSSDRRLARQRRQDEVERGRAQLETWFRANVLERAIEIDSNRAGDIKWDRNNGIFADVLLRADEEEDEEDVVAPDDQTTSLKPRTNTNVLGIPLDSTAKSRSPSRTRHPRKSKVYPCHKAMLIRSEFFMTMFDSDFKEAQETPHLHIVSIDCSPAVLEVILTFLYTERTDFSLDLAVDVLFAADMLFLEKLKAKAAVVISTLGNGTATAMPTEMEREDEFMDIYEILRAAWLTRVQRLEEFAARYIAYRLEAYIDDPDFAELVKESAERISARQETDSIELLDDIRYYLSERFRLRMEDVNFDEAIAEVEEIDQGLEYNLSNGGTQKSDTVQLTGEDKLEQLDAHTLYDNGTEYRTDSGNYDSAIMQTGAVRTLDGEMAGDEMAADAINYQILLGKIDRLLDQLKLDA
jgi:ankyrin repeat and BTB/POZ domain-containing protein 1